MPRYTSGQCPVCESGESRLVGPLDETGAALPPPPGSQIRACRSCGLLYVDPMPHWEADEFEKLYGQDYFQVASRYWETKRSIDIPKYRLGVIERLIGTSHRTALEIGAGTSPHMSRLLLRRGWRVDAQEPSTTFAERLGVSDPRLRVLRQPFLSLSGLKYALIYADSVLEHLPDPVAYFRKISELLEPGGILYFVSPNEYSFDNIVLTVGTSLRRGRARVLCPYTDSFHLIGFTRRAVAIAGDRSGLRILRFARERDFEWYHVLRRGPRSVVRYAHAANAILANAVGLGTNLEVVMTPSGDLNRDKPTPAASGGWMQSFRARLP